MSGNITARNEAITDAVDMGPEEMIMRPLASGVSVESREGGPATCDHPNRGECVEGAPSGPKRVVATRYTSALGCIGLLALATCSERNQFVAPPPPKVAVEFPIQ